MALTLLMIITLATSSARGTVVAAPRLQGEGGHRVPVSESIPTVAEGKSAGSSNCTHDSNQPKIGPCPPE
ncbi:unnamed protein product [Miscanthus lutarioriparius]|uniref:Uncharacterized protein n=1 Tax=Miscanthus lutarioriparius TaxID=422564 RepID=A0A811N6T8_9POAL|nr:unnamed protein product [Miscanthus lutarioriparius]